MIRAVALFIALPAGVILAQDQHPAGDPTAGKKAWSAGALEGTSLCWMCHGEQGQGAFGPDLAGRAISFTQFKHAVRKPWGVMPAFGERELPDQTIADIAAYLAGLPPVAEPGGWRTKVQPDTPAGQSLMISSGCGQCHGPQIPEARFWLGGRVSEANFDLLARVVYSHTELFPGGRMGTFSRLRLTEPTLHEIFKLITEDFGLTIPVSARIAPGELKGGNTTYAVTVRNRGLTGKGLVAEDMVVSLALAPGTRVESGGGPGYQGVKRDPQTQIESIVWQLPRLAAGDEQVCTLTISGNDQPSRLFSPKQSVVRWRKPELANGSMKAAGDDRSLQAAIAFPAAAENDH